MKSKRHQQQSPVSNSVYLSKITVLSPHITMESENLWSEQRKICRICLRIDPRSYDIFNSYYVERRTLYCDMLAYCTKFELHVKDGLPPYMCRNCIEHLEDMYEFHLECEESEKNFLWLLSVR